MRSSRSHCLRSTGWPMKRTPGSSLTPGQMCSSSDPQSTTTIRCWKRRSSEHDCMRKPVRTDSLLLALISRLQASQEVEGKRLECRVPKADPLPEFLLVLLSQEAVQDPHSRQKQATGMMQVPSIQIRVQHHERRCGQNASTVSHTKIAEPRAGTGWAFPSVVGAEMRTLKTMVNVKLCINRSRQ